MTRNLHISFSGGETSAYMTWWVMNNARHMFSNILVSFANTSQESEQTLEFIEQFSNYFKIPVTWLEAVQNHGIRKSPDYRIVDFKTASRDGSVFEDSIKKYGIPNAAFSHCTRSLKTDILKKHATDVLGKDFLVAIGIRNDEIDRMSSNPSVIYPLIKMKPMTKPQINKWWSEQPFRLKLKGYEGNCKWCWKKTLRKHLTLIKENPSVFDFPRRMEALYPRVGPEFIKNASSPNRVFFRGSHSTNDLFSQYEQKKDTLVSFHDENQVFDDVLDVPGACNESCEIYSEEQDKIILEEMV